LGLRALGCPTGLVHELVGCKNALTPLPSCPSVSTGSCIRIALRHATIAQPTPDPATQHPRRAEHRRRGAGADDPYHGRNCPGHFCSTEAQHLLVVVLPSLGSPRGHLPRDASVRG